MKVTGNDIGTVMKYSGHNTLESFSNYIHPTDEGGIVSMQALGFALKVGSDPKVRTLTQKSLRTLARLSRSAHFAILHGV